MKKLLLAIMIAASALSIVIPEAQAKRMGGGASFGRQSQNVARQAPAQSSQATNMSKPAAAPAAAAAAPKPGMPWKGILGGALLGLGLGALFSSMGMGGAMASMLSTLLMVGLLAAAGMFIFRMIKNRNGGQGAQPAFAGGYSGAQQSRMPDIGSRLEPQSNVTALQSAPMASGAAAVSQAAWGIPADFDVPGFLRHTKTYYIRLQAAWDKADVNDIREFSTPEMFGELRLQLQERGASANHTDVVSLDAELMGIETTGNEYLASVKFSGLIKEAADLPTAAFAEVWNLSKPINGQGGWVLAGIQSLA